MQLAVGFFFLSNMFPIFLKLEGKRCLVVGAGNVAEGKIRGLLEGGASVEVVAPEAVWQIQKWSWEGALGWTRERLLGEGLVPAADLELLSVTDDPEEAVRAVIAPLRL